MTDNIFNFCLFVLNLIALAPASHAVLACWFLSDLFDRQRNYIKLRGGFFGELLSCPFCMAYHIPVLLTITSTVPALFVPAPWNYLLQLPVFCLAITDIVHRIQDFEWEEYDTEESENKDVRQDEDK